MSARRITNPYRLANYSRAQIHLVLMLAMTFSSGVVDAVGDLGLDRSCSR